MKQEHRLQLEPVRCSFIDQMMMRPSRDEPLIQAGLDATADRIVGVPFEGPVNRQPSATVAPAPARMRQVLGHPVKPVKEQT